MSVKDAIKDLPTGYHYRSSWNGEFFTVRVNSTKTGAGIVRIEDKDLDAAFIKAKDCFERWHAHGVGGGRA